MNKIEYALLVAERIHANQQYDIFPYMYHIKQVVNIALSFNLDETIIIACALHDSIEDGNLSYNDIKQYFGEEVAEIVFAVTDELGRNRKERHDKTYPKIKSNWKAIAVKLCDRLANMQFCSQYSRDIMKMYINEYKEFKNNIYDENVQNIWNELDKLIYECSN